MKFKVFNALKPADIESQVNAWLESEKPIVHTSGSSMMQIPGGFVAVSSFMVTVFYTDAAA